MGAYPAKSLAVLAGVAARMEAWGREEKFGAVVLPRLGQAPDERVSEEVRGGGLGQGGGRRLGAGVLPRPGQSPAERVPREAGAPTAKAMPTRRACHQAKPAAHCCSPPLRPPASAACAQLCASAALMANNLGAVAILAYTRRGNMASFLSRCRRVGALEGAAAAV